MDEIAAGGLARDLGSPYDKMMDWIKMVIEVERNGEIQDIF